MNVRHSHEDLPSGQTWQVYGRRKDENPGGTRATVDLLLTAGQARILATVFDPILARQLGEHLIEMANYAEGE